MPAVSTDLSKLQDSVTRSEHLLPVKPGNEAEIIWACKSKKSKTHLALIYLHGFTASHEEGMPLHAEFAARYGMNLYLSRLAGHGLIDKKPFLHLTADSLYSSAKEALAIGSKIGDSVILMATSAGGILALELAAKETQMPIKALILYSPCVRIFDSKAWILGGPWGLDIARKIIGGKYLVSKRTDTLNAHYWYSRYRIEGAVAIQLLINSCMDTATFHRVKIPVLTCMYYRDPIHQDSTVSTSAIRWMVQNLGTSANQKQLVLIPKAGDHVLACYIRSHDIPAVRKATFDFSEKILGLKPILQHQPSCQTNDFNK